MDKSVSVAFEIFDASQQNYFFTLNVFFNWFVGVYSMGTMIITLVTGNEQKYKDAQAVCTPYGIAIERQKVKITEMQSDSIEEVAISKAEQAYAELQKPLVVNDAGWRIPTLNGFPGAYMRYINECFAAEDFLRLMDGKTDRRIYLIDVIAYHDGKEIKTFTVETEGKITEHSRGIAGAPSDKVVSLGGSDKTIAEAIDDASEDSSYYGPNVWDVFCQEYANKATTEAK